MRRKCRQSLTGHLASLVLRGRKYDKTRNGSNYYHCYDCLGQALAQRGQLQANLSILLELQEAGVSYWLYYRMRCPRARTVAGPSDRAGLSTGARALTLGAGQGD